MHSRNRRIYCASLLIAIGGCFCAVTSAEEYDYFDMETASIADASPNATPVAYVFQDDEPSASELPNACDRACGEGRRLALRGYGGTSYYHVPGESLFGASYGLDAVYNLSGNWNLLGSFNVNHVNRGSQLVGSLGVIKIHDLANCDPWSFSAAFDQATDSRIDGLYLSQVRAHLGYAFSDRLEIGAVFAAPTNTDPDVPFVFTFLGTDFFETAAAQMSQAISMYVGGQIGLTQWAAIAGYRDDPDTGYLAGSVTRQLTDRVAIYANGSYSWRVGNWAAGAGLEVRFGRLSGIRGRDREGVAASYQVDESGEIRLTDFVPPGIPEEGTTGPERITLDVVEEPLGTTFDPIESIADRAIDSLYFRNVYRPQGQAASIVTGYSAVNKGNPFFTSEANIRFFNARLFNTSRFANSTQP